MQQIIYCQYSNIQDYGILFTLIRPEDAIASTRNVGKFKYIIIPNQTLLKQNFKEHGLINFESCKDSLKKFKFFF